MNLGGRSAWVPSTVLALASLAAALLPCRSIALVVAPARGGLDSRKLSRLACDLEPVEQNYSSRDPVHLVRAGSRFPVNPKNGTPWHRTRSVADFASSNHRHFGDLKPVGDFQKDILAAHEVVRNRAGVAPLRWNSGLASMASHRVNKLANEGCYIRHSSADYRLDEGGFRYIGENLYKVINMAPSGVDVVDAWYTEVDDYNYGPVGAECTKKQCAGRTSPPCVLGHFTQVMGERQKTFIAVCHYGPGGNIVGDLPFSSSPAVELGMSEQACNEQQVISAARSCSSASPAVVAEHSARGDALGLQPLGTLRYLLLFGLHVLIVALL